MLRFRLEQLPPRLREQAERQLCTKISQKNTTQVDNCSAPLKNSSIGAIEKPKKVRAPITMKKKSNQSSAERKFNQCFLEGTGSFEAITLNLPGGTKYTPDFFVFHPARFQGRMLLIEVKGSYRLNSHSRAATAFKTACACFPMFVFAWAEQQKDGIHWKISFYQDGEQIGPCVSVTAETGKHILNLSSLKVSNKSNNQPKMEEI